MSFIKKGLQILALSAGATATAMTGYHFGALGRHELTYPKRAEEDNFHSKESTFLHQSKWAKELRDNGFAESRLTEKMPLEYSRGFLQSFVKKPGYLTVDPLLFYKKDEATGKGSMYALLHVGDHLNGHSGIVHGGFLGTLLDEFVCLGAFPSLPSQEYGVTGTMEVNYRQPVRENQYLLVRVNTTDIDGRKVSAEGSIEKFDGNLFEKRKENVLAEANLIVIEPKWIKEMTQYFKKKAQ